MLFDKFFGKIDEIFIDAIIYSVERFYVKSKHKKRKKDDHTFIHNVEYKRNFSRPAMQLPKYCIPRMGEKSKLSYQKPRTNYSQIAWMSAPGRRLTSESYC